MPNDTDAIDIEELARLLKDAAGSCPYGDISPRCHCVQHNAAAKLAALAPRLAQRVVADATVKREAEAALEAAEIELETVRIVYVERVNSGHGEVALGIITQAIHTALAKLGATS